MKSFSILRSCLATLLLMASLTTLGQYSYMGTYQTPGGKPNYLVNPSDVLTASFRNRIAVTLPESISVPVNNPQYLQATPTNLDITTNAQVWVTFVSEGADFQNALGYYTYPTNNPPVTAPSPANINIIFPNASAPGSGGDLDGGSKVYLGTFSAGTSIGWVLVSNGWNGSVVTNGNFLLYSNPIFNPEVNINFRRHNVMLLDTATSRFVIGFEDKNRETDFTCDHDFNDLVFYATLNPFPSIDTTNVPTLNDTTGTPGGGSGSGVESESLGDVIKNIKSKQLISGIEVKDPEAGNTFLGATTARGASNSKLRDFIPTNALPGTTPVISTPGNLTSYTNAQEVIAVDYTRNGRNTASVLAIRTHGRAYNHTKSICDRFRGAQILALDSMALGGNSYIRFILRQPNGAIEYAYTFVAGVKLGRPTMSLQTNWRLTELQREDTMYNFQVWSAVPTDAVKLLYDVVARLNSYMPLQATNPWVLPTAYISQGIRKNGKLTLYITNRSGSQNGSVNFDERLSETTPTSNFTSAFTIPQGKNNTVVLNIKDGYEYEGGFSINGVRQDEVYLTDGGWALDKDNAYTTINKYEVQNNPNRVYKDDELALNRTQIVKATTKDYITSFKYLTPGTEKLDISTYKTLQFYALGNVPVEVRLVKESITEWRNQPKKVIQLSPTGGTFKISFEDFIAANNPSAVIDTKDVIAVAFTFGGAREVKEVNLTYADLTFTKEVVVSDRSLQSKELKVLPNPSNGNFNLSFVSDVEGTFVLQISDNVGRNLYSKNIPVIRGVNQLAVELDKQFTNPTVGIIQLRNGKDAYVPKQILFKP